MLAWMLGSRLMLRGVNSQLKNSIIFPSIQRIIVIGASSKLIVSWLVAIVPCRVKHAVPVGGWCLFACKQR